MGKENSNLVPQRLTSLEHVLNSLECLWLAAERNKRLTLKIEKVLLINPLARRYAATAKNICHLFRHAGVVFAHVTALLHHVQPGAQSRKRIAAGGITILHARRRRITGVA